MTYNYRVLLFFINMASAFCEAFTTPSQVLAPVPKGMTYTENGALSQDGTGSACLDFFAKVMARDKHTAMSDSVIQSTTEKSWDENPALTLRLIAHLRDIRGGKGERHAAQVCWQWLAENQPLQVTENMQQMPFYGRWKDLLDTFCGTPFENNAISLFATQMQNDILILQIAESQEDSEIRCKMLTKLSLAAKWAPTEKCSHDKEAKKNGRTPPSLLLAQSLTGSVETNTKVMYLYRTKYLSPLRKALDIVERYLCSQQFDEINFSKVPGQALKMYSSKTFPKHAAERFRQWQQDVLAGKTKMNSGTVDPYEVVHLMMHNPPEEQKPTLEAFYHDQVKTILKEQHDRFGSNVESTVVVADVSGSMTGTPMEVAIAMAIWLSSTAAEPWRNLFFTFDSVPGIVDLSRCTGLEDRVDIAKTAPWGGSTDLQATMDLILSRSVTKGLTDEQMPKRLVIVSDMQFNEACGSNAFTNLEVMKAKFRLAGYTMPVVVFWNVRGNTGNNSPASHDERGIMLLSGFSKALMSLVLEGGDIPTPYNLMCHALSNERYDLMTLV